jgi:hypothetical protein
MKSFEELCKSCRTSPEEVIALRDSIPEIRRTTELCQKLVDGTATPDERAEFDELTKSVQVDGPIVLKPDLRYSPE